MKPAESLPGLTQLRARTEAPCAIAQEKDHHDRVRVQRFHQLFVQLHPAARERTGNAPIEEFEVAPRSFGLQCLQSFGDESAYNLAEFGMGLNPASRAFATNLEDLGKLGFGHHGIGSNYAIGGDVKAPCHIDVIYSDAVVEIDGQVVLDRGEAKA